MTDWKHLVESQVPDLPPDVADELAQHLADLYDEAIRTGASEDEARRVVADAVADAADTLAPAINPATRRVADVIARGWQQTERHIASDDAGRFARTLYGALAAVRDAWRSLRSTPALTAFILVILTLGISSATVTFSVVDAVVLRPLPYADPGRLAVMELFQPDAVTGGVTTAPVYVYEQARARLTSFDDMAAARLVTETFPDAGQPEMILAAQVTASLFDVLGVAPLVGRAFGPGAEVAGRNDQAVIGHALWQRRFGGDPAIVGRVVDLADRQVTVVGVMPPGFSYPITDDVRPEAWTPFVAPDDERDGSQLSRYLHVVGRLAPGATLESATAEANVMIDAFDLSGPSSMGDLRVQVRELADTLTRPVRAWMLLLLGAVGLVLLVACANVANLLLTRAARRSREIAIRAAVGASRRRLVLSLLVESLLLSLAAVTLGILVAAWGIEAARAAMPADIARVRDIALDLRVLAVAVTAALATGIGFGIVPAWQASRLDLVAVVKDGAAAATSARTRWQSAFLVAQIAFVSLLLVATTLFVTSFVHVMTADLGFERRQAIIVSSPWGIDWSVTDVLRELDGTPGVGVAAGLAKGSAPLALAGGFSGGSSGTSLRLPGGGPDAPVAEALFLTVTPGYFDAAGITLVRGRDFASSEYGRDDLVVLDTLTARRLFGAADPVGQLVAYGRGTEARVIGLVDAVLDRGPESPPTPQIYLATTAENSHAFLIRTAVDAATALPFVVATIDRLRSPDDNAVTVRLLDDAFRNITANRRFAAGLMSLFGGLALVIGAAGIYGVMAAIVAQRSREFGIRLALGARKRSVVGGVLDWSSRHLVVGLGLGLAAAAIIGRGFGSLFFGVTPADPSTYFIVAGIGLVVGLAASILPAHKASKVDPLVALRSE